MNRDNLRDQLAPFDLESRGCAAAAAAGGFDRLRGSAREGGVEAGWSYQGGRECEMSGGDPKPFISH